MANITGTLVSNRTNNVFMHDDIYSCISSLNSKLNKDKSYRIGIDQSTTCTGIGFKSSDDVLVACFDIFRGSTDKDIYVNYITSFLEFLVKGLTIDLIVVEHNLFLENKHTNMVLSNFYKSICDIFKGIPETRNIQVDTLPPSAWRSYVIDKSKGKYRFNNKMSYVEDICDKYPLLKSYANHHSSKDHDGFEGLGVLLGGEKGLFDEEGNKKPSLVRTKKDMCVYFHKAPKGYYDSLVTNINKKEDNLPHYFLNSVANDISETRCFLEPYILAPYNENYSLYYNVFLMGYTESLCVTKIPRTSFSVYAITAWEFGFEWNMDKDSELIMYTYPKRNTHYRVQNITEPYLRFYDILDRYALGSAL